VSCAMHEVIRLEPSGSAPAQARRVVRAVLAEVVSEDMSQTAELLVSELVTNAITHGTGTVTVSIDCTDDTLAVTVSDDDPAVPELQPECLMAVGGRGLRMIESLASAWGVTPREDGPGKDVWFRLP
jgi:anti-sigma regulatory factor (Ser/Thr protein kinase)